MKKISILCGCLLFSLLTNPSFAAETRYISDKLKVPLRSGKSIKYRIVHQGLASGTRLKLIQQDKKSGYSLVEWRSGKTGWIPTRFLSKQPTAAIRLAQAEKTIARLSGDTKPLVERIEQLEKIESQIRHQNNQLSTENKRLNQELSDLTSISNNAINLDRNNRQLVKDNELLNNEVDVLKAENERLKTNTKHEGYIDALIAVAFGVIITLIIPLFKRQKRRSEWA